MKVYLAAPGSIYPQAREVMEFIAKAGHAIAHDWTRLFDQKMNGKRFTPPEVTGPDIAGVRASECLVLYLHWDSVTEGAWFEAGIAHERGLPTVCFLEGATPEEWEERITTRSFFLACPNMVQVYGWTALDNALWAISKHERSIPQVPLQRRTLSDLQNEFGPWVNRNFGSLKESWGPGLENESLATLVQELQQTNETTCLAASDAILDLCKRLDIVTTTLGLSEETGELARAVVKIEDGIRGTRAEWLTEAEKELADVVLKCAGIAHRMGLDLDRCVWNRWADGPNPIRERDWTKDKLGHGLPQEAA